MHSLEAVADAILDSLADPLLDVAAEKVLGHLVDEIEIPDPPHADHSEDVVVVKLGANAL